MEEEVWRDVKGYEGLYQVSSLGRVKSVGRWVVYKDGRKRYVKENIKTPSIQKNGYKVVGLYKNNVSEKFPVHVLVAKNFLNHNPDGFSLVVDHINNIKTDNRLVNLQVVTSRYNTAKGRKKGTSKYTGVSKCSVSKNKWVSAAFLNGKSFNLGSFDSEEIAYLVYLISVRYEKLHSGDNDSFRRLIYKAVGYKPREQASKYEGITQDLKTKRWRARVTIYGDRFDVGTYSSDMEANKMRLLALENKHLYRGDKADFRNLINYM